MENILEVKGVLEVQRCRKKWKKSEYYEYSEEWEVWEKVVLGEF